MQLKGQFLKYYTIGQILQFMDISPDTYNTYYVNNNAYNGKYNVARFKLTADIDMNNEL